VAQESRTFFSEHHDDATFQHKIKSLSSKCSQTKDIDLDAVFMGGVKLAVNNLLLV